MPEPNLPQTYELKGLPRFYEGTKDFLNGMGAISIGLPIFVASYVIKKTLPKSSRDKESKLEEI